MKAWLPIEPGAQLFKRFFLDSADIASGNSQTLCNFVLRIRHAVDQAVSEQYDRSLARLEDLTDQADGAGSFDIRRYRVWNKVGVGSQNVDERDLVTFGVGADRIVQGNVVFHLPAAAQGHEDFVCYPLPNAS